MRAAIITSKDPLVQVDPLVIVEDDKGIIKYYSKDKDSDKKDNEHFLAVKKGSSDKADLESMLHGYSYRHAEILEYKGSNKDKIDNFLVALGHKKLDNK
jgi:hypothetical protein